MVSSILQSFFAFFASSILSAVYVFRIAFFALSFIIIIIIINESEYRNCK